MATPYVVQSPPLGGRACMPSTHEYSNYDSYGKTLKQYCRAQNERRNDGCLNEMMELTHSKQCQLSDSGWCAVCDYRYRDRKPGFLGRRRCRSESTDREHSMYAKVMHEDYDKCHETGREYNLRSGTNYHERFRNKICRKDNFHDHDGLFMDRFGYRACAAHNDPRNKDSFHSVKGSFRQLLGSCENHVGHFNGNAYFSKKYVSPKCSEVWTRDGSSNSVFVKDDRYSQEMDALRTKLRELKKTSTRKKNSADKFADTRLTKSVALGTCDLYSHEIEVLKSRFYELQDGSVEDSRVHRVSESDLYTMPMVDDTANERDSNVTVVKPIISTMDKPVNPAMLVPRIQPSGATPAPEEVLESLSFGSGSNSDSECLDSASDDDDDDDDVDDDDDDDDDNNCVGDNNDTSDENKKNQEKEKIDHDEVKVVKVNREKVKVTVEADKCAANVIEKKPKPVLISTPSRVNSPSHEVGDTLGSKSLASDSAKVKKSVQKPVVSEPVATAVAKAKPVSPKPVTPKPIIKNSGDTIPGLTISPKQSFTGLHPGLRASLFSFVPPFINFAMHDEKAIPLPSQIYNVLKWKLSRITPVVVRKIVVNSGFKLVRRSNEWCGTWGKHMKSLCFKTLRDFQKMNHFPGTFQIGRKDNLWKNLLRLMTKFGKNQFGFMPRTYILPQDGKLLRAAWEKYCGKERWIVKPPASARGSGIKVIYKWSQIPKKCPLIVQRYISDPYLINGSKFDLRLYAVITSVHPLRVYLYDNGLVRFASVKYSSDLSTLVDRYMHLTNYSINKLSSQYTQNEDAAACQGHKWTLRALWSFLEKERGVDVKKLWAHMVDLVIKTMISGEAAITELSEENLSSRYCSYELFGVDILLDEDLKPWLLEINISPSLHSSTPLDMAVKSPMVRDLLNLAGYQIPHKFSNSQQESMYSNLGVNKAFCFDSRLYTTILSPEEQNKHREFEQIDQRLEYLNTILEELTSDDVRHLIQYEDELTQKGHFQKVFPTSYTHHYLQYFDAPKYYNMLFDAWENRYHKDRKKGIQFLEQLCKEKIHLKVSYNQSTKVLMNPTVTAQEDSVSDIEDPNLEKTNDAHSHRDHKPRTPKRGSGKDRESNVNNSPDNLINLSLK